MENFLPLYCIAFYVSLVQYKHPYCTHSFYLVHTRAYFKTLRLQTSSSASKVVIKDNRSAVYSVSPSNATSSACNLNIDAAGGSLLDTVIDFSSSTSVNMQVYHRSNSTHPFPHSSSSGASHINNGHHHPEHLATLTVRAGPTRKCSLCDKLCLSNAALVRHMRTHTGERPFPCPICPYAARQRYDLNRHITAIHSIAKEPAN